MGPSQDQSSTHEGHLRFTARPSPQPTRWIRAKIYLVSADGKYRWWTEDNHFTDTTLVNRATTELFYGIQNAPSTVCGVDSPFDELATTWDVDHPSAPGEADRIKSLLSEVRGKYPPQVLDLGCGTGRVLDLGLVPPDRFAGVDSSRAMLNLLVRKHPKVAAIYPTDARAALAAGMFTAGQFDWVFLDASAELTDVERSQVNQIARLAVIEVSGDEWHVRNVPAESARRNLAVSASTRGVMGTANRQRRSLQLPG